MHKLIKTVSEVIQFKMAANSLLYNYMCITYFKLVFGQSKEEGKDQESVQSSTTPNQNTKRQANVTHKRAKRSALSNFTTGCMV